jgi:Carboxypeptidase regulatory-like domain/Putative Ig domain
MRRITARIICALAVAVLVCTVSSSALATTGLVLKTSSGPLASDAPIEFQSTNFAIESQSGNVECEQTVLTGQVLTNGDSDAKIPISAGTATGNYEPSPGDGGHGYCKSSAFGPALIEAQQLPWFLQLTDRGEAELKIASVDVGFFPTPPQDGCKIFLKGLKGRFTVGGPVTITIDGDFKSEGGGCPSSGTIRGTFAAISNGKPVESEIGSVTVGTAQVSGTVTANSAPVANASVSVCNQEEPENEEPSVCQTVQTESAGHYTVSGLSEGTYLVTAIPSGQSGYAATGSGPFTLAEGEAATKDISLLTAAVVTGTVRNASSAPFEHVALTVCDEEREEPDACFSTESETGGHYSVEVPAGKYTVLATAPAHSGYGSAKTQLFTLNGGETVTRELTLPELGAVQGIITGPASEPLVDATVSLCDEELCFQTTTNSMGGYTFPEVSDGMYAPTVYPSEEQEGIGTLTAPRLTVSGTATTTEDLQLTGPTPEPPGTTLTAEFSSQNGIPGFYNNEEAPITTKGCVGGVVTATIHGINEETGEVETAGPATLHEAPSNSGTFAGLLKRSEPIHGETKITLSVTHCSMPSEEGESEFSAYIDPSGTVVDGYDGNAPLQGAKVTLLRGAARSGPFTAVTNGSALMSPANRKNPDTSDATGKYGWDTMPGYYRVEASMEGCGNALSRPFEVPPPALGIVLELHCLLRVDTTALPEATREVHYETALAASGASPPFKWKKSGKLPKGLKLSKAGVLSGTIKTSKVAAGSYPLTFEVKDAAKREKTVTLTLKVN